MPDEEEGRAGSGGCAQRRRPPLGRKGGRQKGRKEGKGTQPEAGGMSTQPQGLERSVN